MDTAAKELLRTEYLGIGWSVKEWDDGSMTLRNSEQGLGIDLCKESVDRLCAIFAKIKAGRPSA